MHARFLILTAIFIPVYILYLKTMPPTVFWQDSGIYLAGLKHFGIVYPPGFPLYMLLGVLWLKILSFFPLPLSFAQQVHAFSGLWGAGASGFAGLAVYELIHTVDGKVIWEITKRGVASAGDPHRAPAGRYFRPRTSDGGKARQDLSPPKIILIFPAIIAGLSAGFSYSLWAQSINSEVYSMTGFFAAIIFFFAVKLIKNYRNPPLEKNEFQKAIRDYRKYLFLIALFWGLSFGVHLLTITFLIPLLYLLFNLKLFPFFKAKILNTEDFKPFLTQKAWVLALIIFAFSAFIPYLYLPIRSSANPAVVWSKIDSPQAFINHITGASYRNAEGAISLPDEEKLRSYPILFSEEFFLLGSILGFLGIFALLRQGGKAKSFAIFGLLQTATVYLLISFYERGTEYNFWLIPSYLYWSTLIGIGLGWIVVKINHKLLRIPALALLTLGLLTPQLWTNWPFLNRSSYTLPEEFGKNLIGKLPEKSVFFTIGDQESAIPLYLQKVLGYRLDVNIVSLSNFALGEAREGLAKARPDLVVPNPHKQAGPASPDEITEYLNGFVRDNTDKNLFVITKNYLPLSPEFKLVPAGTIWRIEKLEDPEIIDLSFWTYQFSDPNRYRNPERLELSRKKTDFIDGKPIITYQRAPYSDEAKVFELQSKKNLGDLCYGAYKEKRGIQVKNINGQFENWKDKNLIDCAIQSYEAMFKIDPKFYHYDVFSALSDLYKLSGKERKAQSLIREDKEKNK